MQTETNHSDFTIRFAVREDASLIFQFIRDLAEYEHLQDQVVATEEMLIQSLFSERPVAEVILGFAGETPAAFALFFHNFSTFLGIPGIYLEDLFVRPEHRRRGYGKAMLTRLAAIAVERNCGRLEWSVLDWNKLAIDFYRGLGAVALDEWTTFRVTGSALKQLGGLSA